MTQQPIIQMPKPDAGQYESKRKLLFVPTFYTVPDPPDDISKLLTQYWSEVRDQVGNLERSLGRVKHVYHESVFSNDEVGMQVVGTINPQGSSFIETLCRSTATLEAVEDRTALEVGTDWQRCIASGLVSEKVRKMAFEGYDEALKARYEHMGKRIDETLQEGEVGALFVVEHHQITFPKDVQVFYVAPRSLDAVKKWIEERIRASMEQQRAAAGDEQPSQGDSKEKPSS
ncbi:MAG: hypothetical protein O2854_05660 [Chloroflexi bacterium]|nr:hypothetical protein [Chloroflexota bacterium]